MEGSFEDVLAKMHPSRAALETTGVYMVAIAPRAGMVEELDDDFGQEFSYAASVIDQLEVVAEVHLDPSRPFRFVAPMQVCPRWLPTHVILRECAGAEIRRGRYSPSDCVARIPRWTALSVEGRSEEESHFIGLLNAASGLCAHVGGAEIVVFSTVGYSVDFARTPVSVFQREVFARMGFVYFERVRPGLVRARSGES